MSHPELERPLGDVLELMRLVWAIDQGLQKTSKRMHKALGITAPQRLVLRLLGRFPGLAMGQLADLMRVHPSTITGIVQRLQKRGLIERRVDALDGRRTFLHLTPKGAEWSVDKGGTVEHAVRRVLSTASPVKVRHAREILGSLSEALQKANGNLQRDQRLTRRRQADRRLADDAKPLPGVLPYVSRRGGAVARRRK